MTTTRHAATAPPTTAAATSTFASQYPRYDRMMEPLGAAMISAARLAPGQRVLDIGCGAGATTLEAAWLVGPAGASIGIDTDAEVLAIAEDRAREAALANVGVVCADAGTYDFPPGHADAVISRFGVLHFDEPVAAFANLRRALRRAGRLSFVCARELARNAWMAEPMAAVRDVVGATPPVRGGPFVMADPTRVWSILTAAGFDAIELASIDTPVMVGSDIADALDFFAHTDGRKLAAVMGGEVLARVLARLGRRLEAYARADGVWLDASAWVVTARAP